ncbi:biotin--[acetyl-CoA-carboxylase] ligase [Candidatus Margulisiibacteriota bacterium]
MSVIGSKIIRFATISSTSDQAKEIAPTAGEGTIIVAEEQTGGRGKPGNSWYSPGEKGLYFSIILKPYKNPNELTQLTKLAAAAVVKAINKGFKIEAVIKEPNDILINNKKVAGILTEKNGSSLIVGIGINVNNTEFPEELTGNTTSLMLQKNRLIDKEVFFMQVLAALDLEYSKFLGIRI